MLELKKICKTYETSSLKQVALEDVNINFRDNEFVSILGPSGSGKTTLLNIIGGLDDYTSGNLIISGTSTKKYKDRDWDTYRNHKVGFVFQSYNLIPHQTILANVELALTLSGVQKNERRKRAINALKKVGLLEHINKKPNQLSGGQMQRVAIARALVNDPEILLADEPTGALDSKTSSQIMDLLKEVAKDKLVIMVTHNKELAEEYSTRIIELKDGHILGDSNPFLNDENKSIKTSNDKKTNMSFKTAVSLSLNNLMTKKGRTTLTAFAGSIGIIGIALILSLSNGVNEYIKKVEEETLISYPISISSASVDLSEVMLESAEKNAKKNTSDDLIYSNDTIGDTLTLMSQKATYNNLEAFKDYIESGKSGLEDYTTAINYSYNMDLQLFKSDYEDKIVQVNPDTVLENLNMSTSNYSMFQMAGVWSKMLNNTKVNNDMYDVVYGKMPSSYNEVVILVDENNQISDYVLYALGLKDQDELKEMYEKLLNGEEVKTTETSYKYTDLVGLKFKMLLASDYYKKEKGIWVYKKNDTSYMKEKLESAEEITVVGIVKPSSNSSISSQTLGGILYLEDLEEYVINKSNNSEIVKAQKENKDVNILTGLDFNSGDFDINNLSASQKKYLASLSTEELAEVISMYKDEASETYESVLESLGAVDLESPSTINIYAKDFESKEKIKEIISKYNDEVEADGKSENSISYNDLVGMLMSSVTNIVNMISYVLIGFVSISLVVSSIMIGIITYISVLERTKEIGILRAIGASKKDISRVFNAETLIIGLASGIMGILITIILNLPINAIIYKITNVKHISSLPLIGAIILIIISTVLTIIGGLIPAKMASKKDPVEALRTE